MENGVNDLSNITLIDEKDTSIVSEELVFVFRAVNYAVICKGFAVLGCVTNIINMVIFVKIGFNDSINVSFFGISFADFGGCFTMILATLGLNPWMSQADLPFDPVEMQYVVAAPPHVIFTKITTVLTAFIAFERCVCVALPLKVKSIITCKRVKIFVVLTCVLVTASSIPIPYSYRLARKFSPVRNKTILGLVFSSDRRTIQKYVLPFHSFFYSIALFIFIAICTGVLVTNLRRKSTWRQTAMTTDASKEVNTKENRIAVAVVFISCLFIICFLPSASLIITMIVDKQLSVTGTRANLLYLLASFSLTLETVNAAMNILIYYRHSSNFKDMFKQVFRFRGKDIKK